MRNCDLDVELMDRVSIKTEVMRLRTAIRTHRDFRGDDRCHLDDRELYGVMPEGYSPPARDTEIDLDDCRRFKTSRQDPATEYVSPQREIERLTAELARHTIDAGHAQLCQHIAKAAVAALGLVFEETSPNDVTEAIGLLKNNKITLKHVGKLQPMPYP